MSEETTNAQGADEPTIVETLMDQSVKPTEPNLGSDRQVADADATSDAQAAVSGLVTPDGQPLEIPQGMREGRVFQGYVAFQLESDQGGTRLLSIWAPANYEAFSEQVQPHIVASDPRSSCESYPSLVGQVRERLEEQFCNTLRAGCYPAFCDEYGKPIEGNNSKHPFKRLDLYYCAPDSPVSMFLVYWYDGLAPVVVEIPPELLPRASCGICDPCDPTWENRKAIEREIASTNLPDGTDTIVLGESPSDLREAAPPVATQETETVQPGLDGVGVPVDPT